jgi:hypothetical protein
LIVLLQGVAYDLCPLAAVSPAGIFFKVDRRMKFPHCACPLRPAYVTCDAHPDR